MMHMSIAVFTVKDVMESLAYYREKLGFDVAFEFGKPTFYVGLRSGNVTLHLIAASKTTRQPGHGAVSIFVDDVDALHADLRERGVDVDAEVMRMGDPVPPMFFFRDQDGNKLLAVQPQN